MVRFFYLKGNFFPTAVQVFNAKVTLQILYGIPIRIDSFDQHVEQIPGKSFVMYSGSPKLCKIYGCVSADRATSNNKSLAIDLEILFTPSLQGRSRIQ